MSEMKCKPFGTMEARAFATREYGPSVLATFRQRGAANEPSLLLTTTAHLTPAQAREFAQALLDAADFAEGKDGAK